jgi:hypothetical protein
MPAPGLEPENRADSGYRLTDGTSTPELRGRAHIAEQRVDSDRLPAGTPPPIGTMPNDKAKDGTDAVLAKSTKSKADKAKPSKTPAGKASTEPETSAPDRAQPMESSARTEAKPQTGELKATVGDAESQVARAKPQTGELKATVGDAEPQVARAKPQDSTTKPQAATVQPQAATVQPQAATVQPQAATAQPQAATTEPQAVKPQAGQPQAGQPQAGQPPADKVKAGDAKSSVPGSRLSSYAEEAAELLAGLSTRRRRKPGADQPAADGGASPEGNTTAN